MAVSSQTKDTLVLVAVLGFLAIVLMGLRLVMRRVRGQLFDLSDYLTILAIFCTSCQITFTTVILLYENNNNITAVYTAGHIFTQDEIYRRELGSKMTLVNRAVYNTYIWIQKVIVLLLYKRMLVGLPWAEHAIKVYIAALLVTFVAVQASCFLECHPFYLYWQVVPDPGDCTNARLQLNVLSAVNIATDLMLIVLPMPYLFRIKRSFFQKVLLIGLFSIGIGLVVIAICRLPIFGGTTQVNRDTIGSVEGFFAAFVANIPILVTLRRAAPISTYEAPPGIRTIGSKAKRVLGITYPSNSFREISSTEDLGIIGSSDIDLMLIDRVEIGNRGKEPCTQAMSAA